MLSGGSKGFPRRNPQTYITILNEPTCAIVLRGSVILFNEYTPVSLSVPFIIVYDNLTAKNVTFSPEYRGNNPKPLMPFLLISRGSVVSSFISMPFAINTWR